jgi:hypothetical protein
MRELLSDRRACIPGAPVNLPHTLNLAGPSQASTRATICRLSLCRRNRAYTASKKSPYFSQANACIIGLMKHALFDTCALTMAVITFLVPAAKCQPAMDGCEASPRTVGPFGAIDRPQAPIPISAQIRLQLLGAYAVRALQQTRLSPSGEQIIMYDTSKEVTDPDPRVAVVVDGVLTEVYAVSKLVEYGDAAIYATSCAVNLTPAQGALAIAYTLAGDGTSSAFLNLTWSAAAHYTVAFHRSVGQGRIIFGPQTLELWESTRGKYARRPESSKFECEWCDHRYLVTEFEWRNGTYVKRRSRLTGTAYDPAEISGTPLQIKNIE